MLKFDDLTKEQITDIHTIYRVADLLSIRTGRLYTREEVIDEIRHELENEYPNYSHLLRDNLRMALHFVNEDINQL